MRTEKETERFQNVIKIYDKRMFWTSVLQKVEDCRMRFNENDEDFTILRLYFSEIVPASMMTMHVCDAEI